MVVPQGGMGRFPRGSGRAAANGAKAPFRPRRRGGCSGGGWPRPSRPDIVAPERNRVGQNRKWMRNGRRQGRKAMEPQAAMKTHLSQPSGIGAFDGQHGISLAISSSCPPTFRTMPFPTKPAQETPSHPPSPAGRRGRTSPPSPAGKPEPTPDPRSPGSRAIGVMAKWGFTVPDLTDVWRWKGHFFSL